MNNEIYAVYKTFWLSTWIETSYSKVWRKERYEVLDNNGRLRRDVSNPIFINTIRSICLRANQHSMIFKLFNQLMYGFSCLYGIICHDYANPYSLRQHKHHSCAGNENRWGCQMHLLIIFDFFFFLVLILGVQLF